MREIARPSPFGDRGRPGVRMVGVSRLVSGRADEQGITGRRPSWKIQCQGTAGIAGAMVILHNWAAFAHGAVGTFRVGGHWCSSAAPRQLRTANNGVVDCAPDCS
jgi:hypothetical protein